MTIRITVSTQYQTDRQTDRRRDRRTDGQTVSHLHAKRLLWHAITRRLAVADKPRDAFRHLCKCNGVAGLLKTPILVMCYHAEYGCSASNHVRISSGEPVKSGSARDTPPWDGTDRQTDRRTDRNVITISRSLTRDKILVTELTCGFAIYRPAV